MGIGGTRRRKRMAGILISSFLLIALIQGFVALSNDLTTPPLNPYITDQACGVREDQTYPACPEGLQCWDVPSRYGVSNCTKSSGYEENYCGVFQTGIETLSQSPFISCSPLTPTEKITTIPKALGTITNISFSSIPERMKDKKRPQPYSGNYWNE